MNPDKGAPCTGPACLAGLRRRLAGLTCVGYLGPAGSWSHLASLELWPQLGERLLGLDIQALEEGLVEGRLQAICVPAQTSLVGATPYLPLLERLLAQPPWQRQARYTRMLGYALMAGPDLALEQIRQVLAHPVALQEAGRWLAEHLPWADPVACASNGAAAQQVAAARGQPCACLGPPLAAQIYGLQLLEQGIEQGPQNQTTWWVVGGGG